MKITNIKRDKNYSDVYIVTYEPNFIERFFGVTIKTKKFKDANRIYICGGGHVYYNEKGEDLENFSSTRQAIDNFRRKF